MHVWDYFDMLDDQVPLLPRERLVFSPAFYAQLLLGVRV
jgi:hypothetical protein